MDGTPRELRPIAEQALALVARARRGDDIEVSDDDLRRIELCALVTLDVANFHTLYPVPIGIIDHIGGDPHAAAAEVQDER